MKFKELLNEGKDEIMTSFPKRITGGYGKLDSNLKVGDLVMYAKAFSGDVVSVSKPKVNGKSDGEELKYKNSGITKDKWLSAIGKVTKIYVGLNGDLLADVSGGKSLSYGINGLSGYASMLVRVDKNGKQMKPKWVDERELTLSYLTDKQKQDARLMRKFGIKVVKPKK